MSSVPEERNAIIQRYVPRLITNLTGFNQNDENYKLCMQFVWSHIKHHRYLSVNLHEVKRDIEGICEKFKLNNFHEEETEFRKICEKTLAHELAVNHYENGVMYSIINLLTTLAYDPIGKLKDRKRKGLPVFMRIKKFEEKTAAERKNCIESLLEDNFKLAKIKTDSESELSEWSEDDEMQKTSSSEAEDPPSVIATKPNYHSPSLQPPKKPEVFKIFRIESNRWLQENIQHGWWKNDEVTRCDVKSSHPAANFCLDWQRHLTKRSLGFIKPQPVSLITERCLLREIFWMFLNASDCKFFKFSNDEISMRPNISIPSTSTQTLQLFLSEFVQYMNIMHRLKCDIRKASVDSSLSHTLENYYEVLTTFINEISNFIVQQELIVIEQDELCTVMQFHHNFSAYGKMLNMLWDIHKSSVLDVAKNQPHIRTLYLIANLSNHISEGSSKEKRNLAITFLMACLKTYMRIFDLWWTEARLQDLKMEFIVERVVYDEVEIVGPRLIEKCKERAFYINDSVSNRISKDSIINLMIYFAVEASVSLEIIGKLDRTHEMKQINNGSKSLYDEFIERVYKEIKEFASNNVEVPNYGEEEEMEMNESVMKNQKIMEDIKNGMIDNDDELMLQVFESTFEDLTIVENKNKAAAEPLDIYKMLNQATDSIVLPLENRIERIIKELLAKKISIAEKFVMNIYFNEFSLEHRLQEVRKVFFLESGELMCYFNLKLFPQIEKDEKNWANSYLMTLALNEAICNNNRSFATNFTVNVHKKTNHPTVLDAIDTIEISFNMDDIFESIFTVDTKNKYNEVFRFLLKLKWGLRILNYLPYPEFFKRRQPYSKLKMLDLVMKRIALTRFSMQQALSTIHNNMMVVLQGISHQFDKNIAKSERINEIIQLHSKFVDVSYRKSFLNDESKRTRGIIIEMLKLSKVIKDEWHNIATFHALDSVGKIDDSLSLAKLNVNTIEIEKAFKACESQLKNLLDY